ncbi:MAG: hypothetical protein V4733_00710 [Verrucomicrobiota bacterium]
MMRIDPQDREDILFLLDHLPDAPRVLPEVASRARIPGLPEIRESFDINSRWLLGIL